MEILERKNEKEISLPFSFWPAGSCPFSLLYGLLGFNTRSPARLLGPDWPAAVFSLLLGRSRALGRPSKPTP
jgi:hypothetical protein